MDKSWEAVWKLFTHLSVDGSAEKLSQVIPNQYQTDSAVWAQEKWRDVVQTPPSYGKLWHGVYRKRKKTILKCSDCTDLRIRNRKFLSRRHLEHHCSRKQRCSSGNLPEGFSKEGFSKACVSAAPAPSLRAAVQNFAIRWQSSDGKQREAPGRDATPTGGGTGVAPGDTNGALVSDLSAGCNL